MWTDVLQFFVLFGGIALAVGFALAGAGDSVQIAFDGGRLRPFAPFDAACFSFDPTLRMTFWSALIGVSVAFLTRYGADQMVVQRYFTAKNLSSARKGLWLNAFVSVLPLSLLVVFGVAVYVCSVRAGGEPGRIPPIAVIAGMIRDFPVGVTGVIAAALLAATMSSIDSGINSCCAAYVTDFHSRFFRKSPPERLLSGGIGAAVTFLALVLLTLLPWRVNASGVFYGGICGVIASLAISFGVNTLALHCYAVANLAVTLLFCLVLSVFFGSPALSRGFRP